MKKTLSIFYLLYIFLVVLQFLIPAKVSATVSTYFVSPTGSNSNSGSISAPWATITYALTQISPGDALYLFGGTYNERVTVPSSLSGSALAETSITGVEGQTPIISSSTNSSYVFKIEASYFSLSNVEINGYASNYTTTASCLLVQPKDSSEATNITSVTISSVKVHDCSGNGLFIGGLVRNGQIFTTSNVLVLGSEIYNSAMENENSTAGNWGSGLKIYRNANNIFLSGNIVRDNWGEGIAVTRGETVRVFGNWVYNNYNVNIYIDNSFSVDVQNNFVYCLENSNPSAILNSSGLSASAIATAEEYYTDTPLWGNQLADINIGSNITYACNRSFSQFGTDNGNGGLRNATIANNTFYSTDTLNSPIYIKREPQNDVTFQNNIIVPNLSENKFVYFDSTEQGQYNFDYNLWVVSNTNTSRIVSGANDIVADLSAVNFKSSHGPVADNFNIDSGSLAIDEGVSLSYDFSIDFEGNSRISPVDIGAFEYTADTTNYTIDGTNANITLTSAETGNSVEVGGNGGNSTAFPVRLKDSTSRVLADINVNLTSNFHWSTLTAGTDTNAKKSFVHGLTSQPGASSTYTLYIPSSNTDNTVYLCPFAIDLSMVNENCTSKVTFTYPSDLGPKNVGSATGVSVSKVLIEGVVYFAVYGVNGTGGGSTSSSTITSIDIVSPANSEITNATSSPIEFSFKAPIEYASTDDLFINISPILNSDLTNCTVPTTDIDGDGNTDGYLDTFSTMGAVYRFTAPTTLFSTNGGRICVSFSAGISAQTYSISLYDDSRTYGADLFYVNNSNSVFVSASVNTQLAFNIRNEADTADSNSCDMGTLSTLSIPVANNSKSSASGANECAYGLSVSTNSVNGLKVFLTSNTGLQSGTYTFSNIANNTPYSMGSANYGIVEVLPSTSGYDGTGFTSSLNLANTAGYTFGTNSTADTATPIPVGSLVEVFGFNNKVNYSSGVDNSDITIITHGASLSTGTPGGVYSQTITYYLLPEF